MATNSPQPPTDPPAADAAAPPGAPDPKAKKKRSLVRLLALCALLFLVAMAMSVGGAEYYTSRPDFCGSCHIMDPYYVSWSKDEHGAKLDVWCVECHYAPGQQHTIMAKFRGLSQLASYFSGRAGASRPRAHVNDASCTRAKCHGDTEHLNKVFLIGERRMEKRIIGGVETQVQRTPTVHFVHAKHLEVADRLKENEAELDAIKQRLKRRMPDDAFRQVVEASRSVKPAVDRETEMTTLLGRLELNDVREDAIELMHAEHIRLRLKQLSGITCTACHSYNPTTARHFNVDRETCFVCHFSNQEFNRETGTCLKCHEPPARKIAVHSTPPGETQMVANTAALMDHQDIVNRGIDCASCHLDVIQGASSVTKRSCASCHDQERFTADFDRRDTLVVEEYHRVHVAGQRARCPDCHQTIEHRLIDPQRVAMDSGFLQPVLQNCQHCHPNHHSQQVELLMGVGGHGIDRPMPNAMFGSRVNCRACHTAAGTDFKGEPLIKATQETCLKCHGDDYRTLFDQWMSEIASSVKELEASIERVEAQEKALRAAGRTLGPEALKKIADAKANLQFLKAGDGIHNKNYALQLFDVSQRDMDRLLMDMAQ